MFSASRFKHDYTKSLFKYTEPTSNDFKVFVNGQEVPVYTCRVSKHPINAHWPSHQRNPEQSELASFVNLVSDEAVTLEVIPTAEYRKVMLRPYSKCIPFTDENGIITFTLKQEGQFVLALDDLHNSLFIFNTRPIECPDPASVTYYFGPGIHIRKNLILNSNESVYVDKDALVFGNIYAENAENIHIFGNGIFDDSGEGRFAGPCYENYTIGNMRFFECKNIRVEGVLFRDSASWCLGFFNCFDAVLDSIKVFGQWRYNTDGIDFTNCQNITLKNSFLHSFDDSVCIKGIDRYIETDCKNILTENCVLWCDWGRTCEIGYETACREYENIVFRNCDIIRSGGVALDIQNGDCAEVHDVIFENIRVEYNAFDEMPQLQTSDDQKYTMTNQVMVPYLLCIANHRFRKQYGNVDYIKEFLSETHAIEDLDFGTVPHGLVHGVCFKNIHVYYDEKIPNAGRKYNIPLRIYSVLDDVTYYDITISGITVNEESIALEDLNADIQNTDNFSFIPFSL